MFDIFTKIRGPSFKNAEQVKFDLSGNKVSFVAPSYNYHMLEQQANASSQRSFDLSDPSTYKVSTAIREDDNLFDPTRETDGFPLFNSIWHFSKPLIEVGDKESRTRNDGSVDLACFISKFFNFDSLFIPTHFEQAISFKINSSYGPKSYFGGQNKGAGRFTGPHSWSVKKLNNAQWVSYFIEKKGHPRCGSYIWVAPLTKEHTLSFSFRITGAPSAKLFTCYEEFMTKIVSSCTINYSDEVKAQIAEVANEAAQSSISEHIKPFAWEEYDLRPEKFKRQVSN